MTVEGLSGSIDQAVARIEDSVHTSSQGELPSDDIDLLDISHDPTQAQSYSPKLSIFDRFRQSGSAFRQAGIRLVLTTLALSTLFSADQAATTFIKPTPAEASATPNRPESKTSVEVVEESPLNTTIFIRNTGEKGKLLTENGTSSIFPNTLVNIIDRTDLFLDNALKAQIQPDERMFLAIDPRVKQIATTGRAYGRMSDTIYLLHGYRLRGGNPLETQMAISAIPLKTASNRDTHHLLQVSLPIETPDDYAKSFKIADDCSYIEITTAKAKYRVYTDPMMGRETGRVEVTQSIYKLFLAGVPSGTNR